MDAVPDQDQNLRVPDHVIDPGNVVVHAVVIGNAEIVPKIVKDVTNNCWCIGMRDVKWLTAKAFQKKKIFFVFFLNWGMFPINIIINSHNKKKNIIILVR